MTFYEYLKKCLQNEAVRTEPDKRHMITKVLEEIEKWKKRT